MSFFYTFYFFEGGWMGVCGRDVCCILAVSLPARSSQSRKYTLSTDMILNVRFVVVSFLISESSDPESLRMAKRGI